MLRILNLVMSSHGIVMALLRKLSRNGRVRNAAMAIAIVATMLTRTRSVTEKILKKGGLRAMEFHVQDDVHLGKRKAFGLG